MSLNRTLLVSHSEPWRILYWFMYIRQITRQRCLPGWYVTTVFQSPLSRAAHCPATGTVSNRRSFPAQSETANRRRFHSPELQRLSNRLEYLLAEKLGVLVIPAFWHLVGNIMILRFLGWEKRHVTPYDEGPAAGDWRAAARRTAPPHARRFSQSQLTHELGGVSSGGGERRAARHATDSQQNR